MPTRARFSPASQRGAHSNSATWPVSKRFSSSGMDRSPERSPAFYRGHGNPPLAAHQGARQSIIDVINPRYPIGLQLRDHKLKRHHDPPLFAQHGCPRPSPGSGRAPAMPSPGKIPATWQSRTASWCDSVPDQKMPSNSSVPACREQPARC